MTRATSLHPSLLGPGITWLTDPASAISARDLTEAFHNAAETLQGLVKSLDAKGKLGERESKKGNK
jgi:hypothetical protein